MVQQVTKLPEPLKPLELLKPFLPSVQVNLVGAKFADLK